MAERGRKGEGRKGMTSILDHTVLDHAREFHPAEAMTEKHLRRFCRTGRSSGNYFSPVSVIHLDNYDIRFHRRGVFTAMFIVGPHNHMGGRGPRVSRQKTAISEKGRTRHGENGPTRCGPGKSHTLVRRSSFPFPNDVLRFDRPILIVAARVHAAAQAGRRSAPRQATAEGRRRLRLAGTAQRSVDRKRQESIITSGYGFFVL